MILTQMGIYYGDIEMQTLHVEIFLKNKDHLLLNEKVCSKWHNLIL